MAKTANDVIPFNIFRQVIQDVPQENIESIATDGITKVFQLANYPLIISPVDPVTGEEGDYPFSLTLSDFDPQLGIGEYITTRSSGRVKFTEAPPPGVMEVSYFAAQLSDKEIEMCLNNALLQHDNTVTWDTFPGEYAPYVIWLAAASAFYMLAAKWATEVRMKVETVEIHNNKVSSTFFELARQMERRYKDASAGTIQVSTLTRRDPLTGLLIPFYPEDLTPVENGTTDETPTGGDTP
jgi:hypothetical protein